jgi:endonuclease/exonuclease/phosphatase family metal-dependent hydrolase
VPEIRVLHWNVHSWRDAAGAPNSAAVAGLIRATGPDAVSLVEVNEPWGGPATLAGIADGCGYSWVFGAGLEYNRDGHSGGYGNALLTRAPVTAVQQWRVFSPDRQYDGTEPAEPRTVLLARLADSKCWVGSTHFPASDPGARKAAAGKLQQLVRQLAGPWLICGDFNTEPESCFTPDGTFVVSPDPVRPTYPADAPAASIDYCIAHPGLTVETSVLSVEGSDHLPVLAMIMGQTRGLSARTAHDHGRRLLIGSHTTSSTSSPRA